MIIVLIILTVLAILLSNVSFIKDDESVIGILSGIGAFFLGMADVFVLVVIINYSLGAINIDKKIQMYNDENTKIEKQIDILVKDYMKYESGTLKEFKGNSSITLVSLYPNLKSDELVKTQIQTYTENNKKIKELKLKKLDKKIANWLLYFGD